MMMKMLLACLALSASAFTPAPMVGSQLAQSKLAQPRYTAPAPATRVSEVNMLVTERDADGNPVTHAQMFDPIYYVVVLIPYLYLLIANPFAA